MFVLRSCKFARHFSTTFPRRSDFLSKTRFTLEDQEKILQTLNDCDGEQLSRFDISQTRIRNLEKHKTKEGPFQSLEEVLEIDGLGIKGLERLCHSIVTDTQTAPKPQRRQFLIPPLSNEQSPTSAVGFYLSPNGISWVKLNVANKVENWHFIEFASNGKKVQPHHTYQLALRILNEIPAGDLYVFETTANVASQSNKPASLIAAQCYQLELTSMLYVLINRSTAHNCNVDGTNCVYHLKSNLSARLFKTLIGSERVSSTSIVAKMLENGLGLPCSVVQVDKMLQEGYYRQSPVVRELLGQALLLIVTFMDLCVYKTPVSLSAVTPVKR